MALHVASNRFEVDWQGDGTDASPYTIELRLWSIDGGFDLRFALGTYTARELGRSLTEHAEMPTTAVVDRLELARRRA